MNNWFLASTVAAPIQTPNTGWSLLPLACLVIDQLGIDRKDVIIHMVDQRAGLTFALLAIEAVHGMKYDAQKALNGKVAGLVGLKPFGVDTRLLYESFSEPLNAFRLEKETRHKLSFWACL